MFGLVGIVAISVGVLFGAFVIVLASRLNRARLVAVRVKSQTMPVMTKVDWDDIRIRL